MAGALNLTCEMFHFRQGPILDLRTWEVDKFVHFILQVLLGTGSVGGIDKYLRCGLVGVVLGCYNWGVMRTSAVVK